MESRRRRERSWLVDCFAFGMTACVVVIFGSVAPTGAQVALFDANGTKVGDVISVENRSQPVVALTVGDTLVVVTLVLNDRFLGARTPAFESGDCSGTPYMDASVEPPTPNAAIPDVGVGRPGVPPGGRAGSLVLAPDFTQPLRTITVSSFIHQTTLRCAVPPEAGLPFTRNVYPAREVIDMDAAFVPPFSVAQLGQ